MQMNEKKSLDENSTEYINCAILENIEYVNPITYFSDMLIENYISLEKDIHHLLLDESIVQNIAIQHKNDDFQRIRMTVIPDNFLKIFHSKKKSEQIKLLDGQSISPDQILAFIFKSSEEFSYTFSQYTFEITYKGLNKNELPSLIYLNNESILKIGESTMTDGQLKNVIHHRKIIIAKFIDKDESWHCIFGTYDGISGKENSKVGQHLHYISSHFGIQRDVVLNAMKSGNYPSTPVHITLLDYP